MKELYNGDLDKVKSLSGLSTSDMYSNLSRFVPK